MVKEIILDTSVLVDVFLKNSERHEKAQEFTSFLLENKIVPKAPMHSLFELSAVMKNKKIVDKNFSMESNFPFPIIFVPIDNNFIEKYFDSSLPYLKGCDSIFMSMAKKDSAILITEDLKMIEKSRQAGIEAYCIDDFLKIFVNSK